MGFFGGGTEIAVASSVWNMAGDELDRPIFLQDTILRNILSGTKESLGDTLNNAYLMGPGIKFRNFFRWCDDVRYPEHWGLIGMPTGSAFAGDAIPIEPVKDHIPHGVDETVWVQDVSLAPANYLKWVEQWFMVNDPSHLGTNWTAAQDPDTYEITITMEDASIVAFDPVGYDPKKQYVYAYFTLSNNGHDGPLTTGAVIPLVPTDPLPSVTGYTLDTTVTVDREEILTTVTTEVSVFSDGRPDETNTHTTHDTEVVTHAEKTYSKLTYLGNDDEEDGKVYRKDIRFITTDKSIGSSTTSSSDTVDIGGGVTKTTTSTVVADILVNDNEYQDSHQKVYVISWSLMSMWIYKIGSGIHELDMLVRLAREYGKFFPMLPIRLDNKFIDEIDDYGEDEDGVPITQKEFVDMVTEAYRHATDGGKLDKLIGELNDSDDIGDMDYIYCLFGCSLNTIDNSAKKYIYTFLGNLMVNQAGGLDAMATYATEVAAYNVAYAEWLAWKNAGYIGHDGSPMTDPGPQPVLPTRPTLPTNFIEITTTGPVDINYDIKLEWMYIGEETGLEGKIKAGARKGDITLEYAGQDPAAKVSIYTGPPDVWMPGEGHGGSNPTYVDERNYDMIKIKWQTGKNEYKVIQVTGLIHHNYIYKGKSVTITSKAAMDDAEESGFIIPLHYGTFRELRLVDGTQMSTACVFLVINCYVEKKIPWWQSWFFRILLVIVIAIVSVVFTGGAGFGLLGSHLAVGGAFGLTGMTAAIVGSVANALAALVLTTIIEKVTGGLGPLGAILGAVIGIVAMSAISAASLGQSFTFSFNDFLRVDNLMKLADGLGNAYTQYVQGNILDMQKQLEDIQNQANKTLMEIKEQSQELGLNSGGQIDPSMFIGNNNPIMAESRDTFLARTLMSGSEVADMSNGMITDYSELTLTLPDAFT